MARANGEDSSTHFVTCPVCYGQFDDEENKPKLLSCHHTVCLQCVQRIYNDGSMLCPVCRHRDQYDQPVGQLKTNQEVLHIIKLDEKLRLEKWKTLDVASCVEQLLHHFSPDENPFFEQLRPFVQFIVGDSTRSLDLVWKLQDDWKENPVAVSKLYQTMTSCVGGMDKVHVDYLLNDIQSRWITSDSVQRIRLLDFVHGLANERRDDHTTAQIMDLVGGFAHCAATTPNGLIDMCIEKQKKILSDGWTCHLFSHWLLTCAQTIQARQRLAVVPAMKLLRHLCYLFAVKKAALNNHYQRSSEFNELVFFNYKDIYVFIDQEWQLFGHAVAGLVTHMVECRSTDDPDTHLAAVQERLAFLLAFLKYGGMHMDQTAAASVWKCLVDGAVFNSDRTVCFEWFARIVDMSMIDTKAIRRIYHRHILKLDPRRQTNQSAVLMDCFERFFRAVQCSDGDIFSEDIADPRPGLDFLCIIVRHAELSVAQRAFELWKATVMYLRPQLPLRCYDVNNGADTSCLETRKDAAILTEKNLKEHLMLSDELHSMQCLAKLLDREDMSVFKETEGGQEVSAGIVPVIRSPQRFDAGRSIFILTLTKRGHPLRQILIRPSPRFASSKFVQELGAFCYANPRKIGRHKAKSTTDAFVSLKMKNAMFQPVVPDMLSYRIWLDSDTYAQKACHVGMTGIRSSAGRGTSRVTAWQLVFLLRDMAPGGSHQSKKSLLFGHVVQGFDVIKSLSCSTFFTSKFSDGLRLTLESAH